jgi:hypothetical protein
MATNAERPAEAQPMRPRTPFTPADVETALYAAEIDRLAQTWKMPTREAVTWQNEQDLVIRQPTTISAGARAAGVQLSIFDLIDQELDAQPILPNLARYQSGKSLLERARLVTATKRNHIAHQGPVICRNRVFYTLVPCEE